MKTSIPSAVDATTDRVVLGVGLMIAFCVVAPPLDVVSKLATVEIPVARITTSRFVLQAVLMAPMIRLLGHSFTMPRRFAPSTALAPLYYLEIVSAVFLGYLVFADFPNKMTLCEMFIIVGCGLYIFLREQKVAKG